MNLPPVFKFVVFRSQEDGQWYWHIDARNGRTVCSSEGYRRRVDAIKVCKKLSMHLMDAPIVVEGEDA